MKCGSYPFIFTYSAGQPLPPSPTVDSPYQISCVTASEVATLQISSPCLASILQGSNRCYFFFFISWCCKSKQCMKFDWFKFAMLCEFSVLKLHWLLFRMEVMEVSRMYSTAALPSRYPCWVLRLTVVSLELKRWEVTFWGINELLISWVQVLLIKSERMMWKEENTYHFMNGIVSWHWSKLWHKFIFLSEIILFVIFSVCMYACVYMYIYSVCI